MKKGFFAIFKRLSEPLNISETRNIMKKMGVKEFWKKMNWWKKIILLILVITAIVIVWKIVNKPYYIKDDLCYSDFLENCEGKKVEVTGKIVRGQFCPKRETEMYILCNTNNHICKPRYRKYAYDCSYGMSYDYKTSYDDCLSLVQICWTEDAYKKINDRVETLLPNPTNKKVKIVGEIFIERTEHDSSVSGKVGIMPESITVIKNES